MSSTPQPLISVPGQDGKAHTPTLDQLQFLHGQRCRREPPMPSPTHHHPKPSRCRTPLPPAPSSVALLEWAPCSCVHLTHRATGAHTTTAGVAVCGRCGTWEPGDFNLHRRAEPWSSHTRHSLLQRQRGGEGAEISGGPAASEFSASSTAALRTVDRHADRHDGINRQPPWI